MTLYHIYRYEAFKVRVGLKNFDVRGIQCAKTSGAVEDGCLLCLYLLFI